MTDQTPSTEDVRYGYRTGVTAPILPVEAGDAFDTWLAARDRETAAKALREAAEEAGSIEGGLEVMFWLNARADWIEAGDE